MTLRHLKIFVTVCKHKNITKAAKELFISQPAVSTAIKELEQYYNVILFNRINNKLILTDIGNKLLIYAKSILSEFDNFEHIAQLGESNPTLKIGSSLTLGITILPKYYLSLKKYLPNVDSYFTIDQTTTICKKIENADLDIAIIEGEITSNNITKIPFSNDELILICSKEYYNKDTISIDELSLYPFLLREKGSASRDFFDNIIKGLNIEIKTILESLSNEAIIEFAINNIGFGVLPMDIVSSYIKKGILKKVSINELSLKRTHYIIHHKNKILSNHILKAIELLKK